MCRSTGQLGALLIGVLAAGCFTSDTPLQGERQSRRGRAGRATAARPHPTSRPTVRHAVFSLRDNRLLAHVTHGGGLSIQLGAPGVAKYLRFGKPELPWKLNRRHEGRAVALATARRAWLTFPLTAEQARAKALHLELASSAQRSLKCKLNGVALPSVALERGWQKPRVALPDGAARAGENQLELRWRGPFAAIGGARAAAAVASIHVGDAPPGARAPLHADGALVVPPRGGLVYYLWPYRGTRLHLGWRAEGDGCAPRVRLDSADLPSRTLTFAARSRAADLDMTPFLERVVRLELSAPSRCKAPLRLTRAELTQPGSPPRLRRGKPATNVVFWLIDNARSDRFSAYNPDTRVETPVFDQLAQSGTVFRCAYSTGNESRVSHASLFTGLYPAQHGMTRYWRRLSTGWPTLPELLRQAKLYTAGWIANGYVSPYWGFGEGWQTYHNLIHEQRPLSAEALANHGIRFVRRRGKRPFFLYLGTIDAHVSWHARRPWIDRYYPRRYRGPFRRLVAGKTLAAFSDAAYRRRPGQAAPQRALNERHRPRIIAIYDSTISYNDHHLGRLVAALKQRGVWDDTLLIITADHGEELWERGKVGHGHASYEELVSVPLLIHYPRRFGAGVEVRECVDGANVLATILDALDRPLPSHLQGMSLLPLAQGIGRGYPRAAFTSHYELDHALRVERFKLLSLRHGPARLYDLGSKAGERKPARRPLARRWLTDLLSTFLVYQDRWRQARWGGAANHRAALPRDLESGRAPPPISAPPGDRDG